MKYAPLLLAAALCTGCTSLDNPLSNLRFLHSGRDARTFNPQTGEYEWPKDATPRPQTRLRPAAPATPVPKDDGRSFDPLRGEFRDPSPGR